MKSLPGSYEINSFRKQIKPRSLLWWSSKAHFWQRTLLTGLQSHDTHWANHGHAHRSSSGSQQPSGSSALPPSPKSGLAHRTLLSPPFSALPLLVVQLWPGGSQARSQRLLTYPPSSCSGVTPTCLPNGKLKPSQNKSLWSSYTDFQAIHPRSSTAINGTITQWGAQGKTLEPSFSSTIFLPSNNSTPINTDSLLEDKGSLHQLSSAVQPRSFSDPESYCWSWDEQALFSLKEGFCVCCPSVWKRMPTNLP